MTVRGEVCSFVYLVAKILNRLLKELAFLLPTLDFVVLELLEYLLKVVGNGRCQFSPLPKCHLGSI